jgi:ABC-type bacteriocin/lantibiotic exporter with double-glycine peptidase domain
MLKGTFNKITAYIGVITGIFGIISVVGPLFIAALGMTAIITSVFTTLWVLLVGFKLLKLSHQCIILES